MSDQCVVWGKHPQDSGWKVTRRVTEEDGLKEGAVCHAPIQRTGLLKDPAKAGSSALGPSKAGETKGRATTMGLAQL